jgi:phosphate transport system permease protein
LVGTLVTSGLALLVAVPVAIGAAAYLVELASPTVRRVASLALELLAAVPSVVFGLVGFFLLRPFMLRHVEPQLSRLGLPFLGGTPQGSDLLTASLVLALMIVPTIATVAREVIAAVPTGLREAALALGATPGEVIRHVVVPAARAGLVGATILGLGRALGETMAVTMLVGNRAAVPRSLLDGGATMASVIANQYGEAQGHHLAALTHVGLWLFVSTVVLDIAARLLVGRTERGS